MPSFSSVTNYKVGKYMMTFVLKCVQILKVMLSIPALTELFIMEDLETSYTQQHESKLQENKHILYWAWREICFGQNTVKIIFIICSYLYHTKQ